MDPLLVAGWVVEAGWHNPADAITATSVALAGGGDTSPAGLFGMGTAGDGQAQATAAYQAWSARGWGIFANYTNRHYLLFIPIATPAVAVAIPGTSDAAHKIAADVNTAASTPAAVLDVAKQGAHTLAFLGSPAGWQRILKVAIGAALIVGGGLFIVKRTSSDQVKRGFAWIGEHKDELLAGGGAALKAESAIASQRAARAASAPRRVPRTPAPAAPGPHRAPSNTAPVKSTGATPARPRSVEEASRIQQTDKRFSNEDTTPIPTVKPPTVRATAPAPPRKLPGESAIGKNPYTHARRK